MRFAIVIVLVLSACTGATTRERNDLAYRYVPPASPELPGSCASGSNNGVAIGADFGTDPPVIVLDDDFLPCFGQDPPRPRIAIWGDGTILFVRDSVRPGVPIQELVQGTIPSSIVDKLIDDVTDAVEHSPRRFDTDRSGLGGGQTSLIVWKHGRWRAAIVTGAFPNDFIRAVSRPVEQPAPPPPPPPPPRATGSDDYGVAFSGVVQFEPPLPPPTRFAKAYKELLDARPTNGAPITRDELSVAFFPLRVLGNEALARKRREITWPVELPQPPVDVDPCADDVECVREIAPAHRELAEKLGQEIHRSNFNVEFTANGHHFLVRFDSHYHGERGIQRLERCAAHLGEPAS